VQEDRIVIESDWMASAQLDGLVAGSGAESFGLTYDVTRPATDRGVDPTIIVAVVTGLFNVLVPFMTRLAQRLFASEPDASLTVSGPHGMSTVVLTADIPAERAAALLDNAVKAGARNVRISIREKRA
jgi:hypothetical protein